ncbi:hypothetical protein SAY87_016282 [Trapa incisa]|uniref:Uncharacterized protein n=1 Tax=Trapa incisa TaxID=236973 RepID=A0AAN7L6J7_9MYRT|nr:hypothetical protein SAY87_016282 [Trapa incisa]
MADSPAARGDVGVDELMGVLEEQRRSCQRRRKLRQGDRRDLNRRDFRGLQQRRRVLPLWERPRQEQGLEERASLHHRLQKLPLLRQELLRHRQRVVGSRRGLAWRRKDEVSDGGGRDDAVLAIGRREASGEGDVGGVLLHGSPGLILDARDTGHGPNSRRRCNLLLKEEVLVESLAVLVQSLVPLPSSRLEEPPELGHLDVSSLQFLPSRRLRFIQLAGDVEEALPHLFHALQFINKIRGSAQNTHERELPVQEKMERQSETPTFSCGEQARL